MVDHVSNFTQPEDKIILDLVNHDNGTNLSTEQVELTSITQTDTPGNVQALLTSKPDSGYSGDDLVQYQRLNIQDFMNVYFPDGMVVQQGGAVNISDLLPEINVALGTAIPVENIIDAPIEGWTGEPGEKLSLQLAIKAISAVYHGYAVFQVSADDIPLSSAISQKTLSGLNMPASGVTPEEPEVLRTETRYKVDPTIPTSNGQPAQVGVNSDGPVPGSIRWVTPAGEGEWLAWEDLTDSGFGTRFSLMPVDATYLDIRNTDAGGFDWEEVNLNARFGITGIEYFQTDKMPLTAFTKPNLVSVPAYLPKSVTNLSSMFESAVLFNDPNVSQWKTPNVTALNGTFYEAESFNQPLAGWDVSKVVDMEDTFNGASSFNQDLSGWNVSSVTETSYYDHGTTAWVLPKPPFPSKWVPGEFTRYKLSSFHDTNTINFIASTTGANEFAYQVDEQDPVWLPAGFNEVVVPAGKKFIGFRTIGPRHTLDDFGIQLQATEILEFQNTATPEIYFTKTASLVKAPASLPAAVTDLSRCFHGASAFNQDLSGWDVSRIAANKHVDFDTGTTAWTAPKPNFPA